MKVVYQSRAILISTFFALGAVLILSRIIYIQMSPQGKNLPIPSIEWKTLDSERGKIYDRNMHLLAGNQTVYSLGLSFANIDDPNTVAMTLNSILGMDYQKILALIKAPPAGSIYYQLSQAIPSEKGLKLLALKKQMQDSYQKTGDPSLSGVDLSAHLIRSYPDKSLASNALGFTNLDNKGNYGVEQMYDDVLAGAPKTVPVSLNPYLAGDYPNNPSGADLILTIDRDIQAMVENELNQGVKDTGAVSGTIVVMDPKTGAILAMASSPQMDLNQYSNFATIYPEAADFNRAVSVQFEPGSIFKILTMSAAIDSGLVTRSSTYLDQGFYNIGGWTIFNWDRGAWGVQDMVGCLQHSLNVCMARLADNMGEKTFYTYMRRFGIGSPTRIDLAYEATGHLKDPSSSDWYKVDLGTNSFGQGVSVTPIQMMTAVTALINDGRMVYPHVVYSMISNGSEHITPVQTIGTPISPQTARTVSNMLADALDAGGSLALVKGYRIAGKTGTASIPLPTGGYDPVLTNQSFLGWGPVDDPKFMVLVWLEKPVKADWASYLAAPIFHDLVQKLVVLMDIPPDDVRKQLVGQ